MTTALVTDAGRACAMPLQAGATGLPDRAIARLHELAWRPGVHMHASWWPQLGLDAWRGVYATLPGARAALDQTIATRRGFPLEPLPARLDDDANRLVALEMRLPALCVALGLVAFACDAYLLLGAYRQALRPVLGARGCDQLLVLNAGRVKQADGSAQLPPERILEEALHAGVRLLDHELAGAPVWRALSIVLPAVEVRTGGPHGFSHIASPVATLFRLNRFL